MIDHPEERLLPFERCLELLGELFEFTGLLCETLRSNFTFQIRVQLLLLLVPQKGKNEENCIEYDNQNKTDVQVLDDAFL